METLKLKSLYSNLNINKPNGVGEIWEKSTARQHGKFYRYPTLIYFLVTSITQKNLEVRLFFFQFFPKNLIL